MKQHLPIAFACASFLAGGALLDGCSGTSTPATGDDASTGDDAATGSDASPDAAADVPIAPQHVTFRYTPSWSGVKSVTVVGGFGQATDWNAMQPFVTLASDGSGGFTGSADLPAGDYLYVFHVVGDAAAATPDTFMRYAIDPSTSAVAACPMESPTFDKNAPNPCSKLTIPLANPATRFHVRGTVKVDGQPVSGYLVEIERNENMAHHFFVDRVTTDANGNFDLAAAPGQYRLQVLHPTYLNASDATRDPIVLKALRRAISSNFPLSADVTVAGPDVGYHDYAAFAPRDAGTLPTHFVFGGDGGTPTRVTVYGTGNNGAGTSIGDPWFSSPLTTTGAVDFDGGFNTKQAMDPGVKAGERYFWGIENAARVDAGVTWTGQSMVFPITWQ